MQQRILAAPVLGFTLCLLLSVRLAGQVQVTIVIIRLTKSHARIGGVAERIPMGLMKITNPHSFVVRVSS